jgi:phage tail-like protein
MSSNFGEFEEFKFLTINTPSLWKQGIISEGDISFHEEESNNGDYSKTGGIMLSGFTEFARTESFQIPITTAIDLDLDLDCDIFYILDKETGKLLLYDFRSGYFEWVKCLMFKCPKSIKAGKENLYILNENDLFVIAKTNFQIRKIFEHISTNLLDIAVDTKEENILILNTEERQIYRVSIVDNAVYTLLNDDERRDAISKASSIFVGRKDDKIYVLDPINKRVIVLPSIHNGGDDPEFRIVYLDGESEFVPSDVAVLDEHNIFIGDVGSGVTYHPHPRRYNSSGLSEVLEYSRKSNKIILDRKEYGLYIINYSDNIIIKFEPVTRFLPYGSYISPLLDSGIHGLKWHKFVLDMNIPDPVNTSVEVFYYASDMKNPPTNGQWIKTQFSNPKDSLMFDAVGRYLWLKFSLFSNNSLTSPIIYMVKTYLPRLSYLRYLPAIYQENPQSKEFLERFLALFETFFVQIEELNFTKYIDPRSTPDEFLPWLSSWLALAYDENWPKKNFRKLIELAPQIYKMRGTRRGIEKMLSLYLASQEELDKDSTEMVVDQQSKFMIIENFQLDPVKNEDEYMRLFCNDPYTFCVIINPLYIDERKKIIIKKIVESEKPAHTVGNIVFLEPWFYLGAHTYLGINTVLQESKFILGDSAIGRDTILGRRESSGSIGSSRIGIDTHIF